MVEETNENEAKVCQEFPLNQETVASICSASTGASLLFGNLRDELLRKAKCKHTG